MPGVAILRVFDMDAHLLAIELAPVPVVFVFLDPYRLIRRDKIIRESAIDFDRLPRVDVLSRDPHALQKFHSCQLRFLHRFFLLCNYSSKIKDPAAGKGEPKLAAGIPVHLERLLEANAC